MNRRLIRSAPIAPSPAPGMALAVILGVCGGLCSTLALSRPAHAESKRVVHYTFEQVWPAALRFLRLDAKCEIVERDAEAGYVIFDLIERDKKFRGTLEIVRLDDEGGKPAVRTIARIENQPNYTEAGLLRRLESKLRNELGDPRPRPPPAKDAEGKKNEDRTAER